MSEEYEKLEEIAYKDQPLEAADIEYLRSWLSNEYDVRVALLEEEYLIRRLLHKLLGEISR